jgi:peptide/nickel transport system substrate-binding protein
VRFPGRPPASLGTLSGAPVRRKHSAYKNPTTDQLIERVRFTTDNAEYEASVKAFIALCIQEVPIIPLNQPIHDVAMWKSVGGYKFWFHREPDFRQFAKG